MKIQSTISLFKIVSLALIVSTGYSWANPKNSVKPLVKTNQTLELTKIEKKLCTAIENLKKLNEGQDRLVQNSQTPEMLYVLGALGLGTIITVGGITVLISLDGSENIPASVILLPIFIIPMGIICNDSSLFSRLAALGVLALLLITTSTGSYFLLKSIYAKTEDSPEETYNLQEKTLLTKEEIHTLINETRIQLINAKNDLKKASIQTN